MSYTLRSSTYNRLSLAFHVKRLLLLYLGAALAFLASQVSIVIYNARFKSMPYVIALHATYLYHAERETYLKQLLGDTKAAASTCQELTRRLQQVSSITKFVN
jgi:hypothetical protein